MVKPSSKQPKIMFGAAAYEAMPHFASIPEALAPLETELEQHAARPSSDAASQPSWGPGAYGALSAEYTAKKYPWIARALLQIDAELMDIGTDDQSRIALGIETRLPNGYVKRQLASPWIFSLDALNSFCEYNWLEYAKVSATQAWPKQWFWVTAPSTGVRPRRADSFAERGLLSR
jgi:hypothetical protein